jgi:hypothetical protein
VYQAMAIFSAAYLGVLLALVPARASLAPNLADGFAQVSSTPVILALQLLWITLFLYYGRSRVTASTLSFHVVADRT